MNIMMIKRMLAMAKPTKLCIDETHAYDEYEEQ